MFYATPDPFLLNKIYSNQLVIAGFIHVYILCLQESVDLGLSASVPLRTDSLLALITDMLLLPASNTSFTAPSPRKVAHALQILLDILLLTWK